MLQINMADVANILTICMPYLIALAVIVVLAIVVTIAVKKLKKPTKYMIRRQSWIAVLLAVIVVANLVCMGPMASMLTLVTGNGTITQESSDRSEALVQQIAEEGAVLLKNEDNLLPMANNNHLNLWLEATLQFRLVVHQPHLRRHGLRRAVGFISAGDAGGGPEERWL